MAGRIRTSYPRARTLSPLASCGGCHQPRSWPRSAGTRERAKATNRLPAGPALHPALRWPKGHLLGRDKRKGMGGAEPTPSHAPRGGCRCCLAAWGVQCPVKIWPLRNH
ncbi:hypothetical protein SEVIR_5G087650v4 [Setaria viridis]